MKKNDFVTLTIEDIGVGGEGIGKAEGMTFFVKDAVVGDVIQARKELRLCQADENPQAV